MSANTVNPRFIACLCAVALLAVSATVVTQDTSALQAVAAVTEPSLPATANGIPESEQKGETPDRALAATVLGEEVHTGDAGEMQQIVLTRLFDRYAEEQGIAVTTAEIDAFVENIRRGMRDEGLTAEDDLTPEEMAEVERMRRDMGRSMIRQWKLNGALYRRYGGRIIDQQLGPEPLDAYRRYLEERQAAGDFEIHEKTFADTFWRYFTDESMHSFYERGSEEEARAFATPPWERKGGGE